MYVYPQSDIYSKKSTLFSIGLIYFSLFIAKSLILLFITVESDSFCYTACIAYNLQGTFGM